MTKPLGMTTATFTKVSHIYMTNMTVRRAGLAALTALLDRRLVARDALNRFLRGRDMSIEAACQRLTHTLRGAMSSISVQAFIASGPDVPGFDLLAREMRELMSDAELPPARLRGMLDRPIPAIVVTGSVLSNHEREAAEHDFHLLLKPVVPGKLRAMINLGYTDAFRVHNNASGQYTFWDYQAGSWPRNNGIRIDHFLLSPAAADRLAACTIDKEPRGREKASDHTPIIVELSA